MTKILLIKKIQNGNWLQIEDGKWYNLSVLDDGNVYLDGQFIRKDGEEIIDPINNRFEILDL